MNADVYRNSKEPSPSREDRPLIVHFPLRWVELQASRAPIEAGTSPRQKAKVNRAKQKQQMQGLQVPLPSGSIDGTPRSVWFSCFVASTQRLCHIPIDYLICFSA